MCENLWKMRTCWNILVKTNMWMTTWCFTTYLHQSLKIWRQKQQRTTFGLREQQGIHALLIIIWNKSKTVLTAPFDLGLLGSFFVSLPLQSQSVPFPECHFTEFLSFCYYFDFCVTHFFFPHSISPIIFVTSLFIKWFMFFLPTPVWKHTYWDLNGLVE